MAQRVGCTPPGPPAIAGSKQRYHVPHNAASGTKLCLIAVMLSVNPLMSTSTREFGGGGNSWGAMLNGDDSVLFPVQQTTVSIASRGSTIPHVGMQRFDKGVVSGAVNKRSVKGTGCRGQLRPSTPPAGMFKGSV